MNKPLPRAYWKAERIEKMRRARNAAFYATAPSVTPSGRAAWRNVASGLVADAREINRALIQCPKVS